LSSNVLPFDLSAFNDVDSRLAMELAIDISEPKDIIARYGITATELKLKLKNPAFAKMVQEFRGTWKSDLSVKERIRLKSMVLVEDSLLELHSLFHDASLAPAARMDAFKNMAKVATVDTPDKEGASVGDRVQINISIPGAEKPISYEGDAAVVGEYDAGKALTNSS
jgi:hypothetical protein